MTRKDNKLGSKIMVIAIAFLMISSVIGFFQFSPEQKFKEAGLTFIVGEQYVYANTPLGKIEVNYLPSQVQDISVAEEAITLLTTSEQIGMASSLNDSLAQGIALAQYELARHMALKGIAVPVGFTDKEDQLLTCDAEYPVVLFSEGTATLVEVNSSCIRIEALSEGEMIRIKDRLLYIILGIRNE